MVDRLEVPIIGKLNSLACEHLEKLEQSYPIITQPSEQLYQQTKQLYDVKVKPTVDQVTSVPEKVDHIKTYANDSIRGVQNYTTDTIKGAKYYTSEVVDGVKEFSQDTIKNVKRCSNYAMQGVKNYTREKFDNVANSTTSTIDSVRDSTSKAAQEVKDLTNDTVERVKSMTLSELLDHTSNAGAIALNSRIVTDRIQGILQATEALVDYYLPNSQDEKENDLPCKEQSETLTRITILSLKARQRLYARAVAQLQQAQLLSKKTLGHLSHTMDLIDYARANIDSVTGQMRYRVVSAGDKVCYYWHEINRPEVEYIEMKNLTETGDDEEENIQNDLMTTQTFEKRLLASARKMALQLKRGVHLISTYLPLLPVPLVDSVISAKDSTDKLCSELASATTFKDLPKKLLEQTKYRLVDVEHTVSLVAHHVISSWAITWLISWTPTRDSASANSQPSQPEATPALE